MTLLYTGRVMRIDPAGPVVRVPLLGRDALWGPLPTGVGGLTAGEQVVVGQLGTSRDQLIILCRLAPDASGVSGGRFDQVEAAIGEQRTRLTSIESQMHQLGNKDFTYGAALASLRDRLGSVENAATALPAVIAVGGDNATAILGLQNDVAALRSDVTALQSRVSSLEAWRGSGGGGTTPTASISAGTDLSTTVGSAVSRTATTLTGTVTAWEWRIVSGPTGVDSVLSTTNALSWTPTVAGSYLIGLYGTYSGGTAYDDVAVTVTAVVATSTPGALLNLGRWELTLPIAEPADPSNPLDVYAGGSPNLNTYTHPNYFRVGSDGDGSYVEFAAPVTGAGMVTTSAESGSTRTELREMGTVNGGNSGTKAAWSLTDGQTHSLTVTLKVDPTDIANGRKELIIGQIHGAGSTPPLYLAANFASTPKVTIFKNGPGFADILSGQIIATTLFTYRLVKTSSNRVQVSYALGTAAALPGTPQYDWPASDFTDQSGNYFKAGVYNKTPLSTTAASGVGRVRIYDLTLSSAASGGTGAPQTLGVGGIAAPSGAILATGDTTSALTISTSGTSSSPRVYDGQGKKVGRVTFSSGVQYVVVQNYYIQSGNQYGVVFDNPANCTLQNCDISNVKVSGDGDLNAITVWGGNNNKIKYNTAVNYVSGDPGGSHTDCIQTWVSSSHPNAANNYQIIGNRFIGPANPSRVNSIPSIHQIIMVEGAGRGGNSGGSGNPTGWYISDNEFGDSWNQSIKLDGGINFIICRNRFVGSSDKVFDLPLATGVQIYSDNQFGSGYGSVGATVTSGSGPAVPA